MDKNNNKTFISFLMDTSDLAERIKQEMRAVKISGRLLSTEEHEAISELLLGTISDLEVAESDLQDYTMVRGLKKFAAVQEM